VLINEPATIVYLAGQNAITPHIWTARADRLEYPDRLIIDLDPSDQTFAEVRAVAREAGDLLREIGLEPFAMTTGSRGLHVVTPLRRTADYEAVNAFAREVAAALVERDPDTLTAEFRREKRGDRLFLDIARNAYGQHAVAPYAVRALPAAPVAMPLRWEELSDDRLQAQRWTVANAAERLADEGDAWEDIRRSARSIGPARSRLRRLGRS
jgi:bifunctional non-homologous end joining protein LigD